MAVQHVAVRRNMKTVILIIACCLTSVAQQATPPQPSPPPQTQPAPLEPKESVATLKIKLAEAEKKNLGLQRQLIVSTANAQIANLSAQEQDQQKIINDAVDEVKKENGWGDDVRYAPTFIGQDGREFPGHWQKSITQQK